MTFTLTREHVERLMAAAAEGDLGPFVGECDPAVEWRQGASDEKGEGRSGVYDLEGFATKVAGRFPDFFVDGKLRVIADSIDVIGNKAIIEGRGEAETIKAGPYGNRVVLIAEWSAETGKVVRFREYLDTAMTWAVKDKHGVY